MASHNQGALSDGQVPCPTPHPPQGPYSMPHPGHICTFFSLWPQEYKVMAEIMLLQEAAHSYTLEPEPEQHCGAWFKDMEQLSENES